MTMRYDDWNQRTEGEDGDDCDYRRTPSFVSKADPERLEKMFAKAFDAGRLSRWRIACMEKRIADAQAEARTCNPLFKTINGEAE